MRGINSKPMKKILIIFGTRPEAIKIIPLFKELRRQSKKYTVLLCATAQHRQMLDQVLSFFQIKPDFDLNLMKENQSLSEVMAKSLVCLEEVLEKVKPDLVIVQGDTTTALVGALASYYKRIPVAHLEAGLRSGNKYSPYPEEVNRVLISRLADYHFAPTDNAYNNLIREGVSLDKVWVTGNTVIDALFDALKIIKRQGESKYNTQFNSINFQKKLILITGHRRENFGLPFRNICQAIKEVASKNDVEIIYPVHLNPNVQKPVREILGSSPNIHLINPLEYPSFVLLMSKSYLIMTDSGGVQEEAPSLGIPILVTREVTERPEGIATGNAKMVGSNKNLIIKSLNDLLSNKMIYASMSEKANPYGEGKSSQIIVKILSSILLGEKIC